MRIMALHVAPFEVVVVKVNLKPSVNTSGN